MDRGMWNTLLPLPEVEIPCIMYIIMLTKEFFL